MKMRVLSARRTWQPIETLPSKPTVEKLMLVLCGIVAHFTQQSLELLERRMRGMMRGEFLSILNGAEEGQKRLRGEDVNTVDDDFPCWAGDIYCVRQGRIRGAGLGGLRSARRRVDR